MLSEASRFAGHVLLCVSISTPPSDLAEAIVGLSSITCEGVMGADG
jgi:hypothetical protein